MGPQVWTTLGMLPEFLAIVSLTGYPSKPSYPREGFSEVQPPQSLPTGPWLCTLGPKYGVWTEGV